VTREESTNEYKNGKTKGTTLKKIRRIMLTNGGVVLEVDAFDDGDVVFSCHVLPATVYML
jgi:hypothetical protein